MEDQLKRVEAKLDLILKKVERIEKEMKEAAAMIPPSNPNDLVNWKEALTILGLFTPGKDKFPRGEFLDWLTERGLLIAYGSTDNAMMYSRSECQILYKRHVKEGLSLTERPSRAKKQSAAEKKRQRIDYYKDYILRTHKYKMG